MKEETLTDLNTMAASVGSLLKQRQQTIAVSESSTAGLISASLLAVPGASAYYLGGAVVYTGAARQGLLRLSEESMEGHQGEHRGLRAAEGPHGP